MRIKRNNLRKKITVLLILVLCLAGILFIKRYLSTPAQEPEPSLTLYLSKSHQTISLKMEEYIIGTVAAEMPASFHLEALKAQAVCARTYACRRLIKNFAYPLGADLSDDIGSCQAYISRAEFYERHPQDSDQLWKKIERAVNETRGEIMFYGNEPIDALYHSTCGGRTESAREIWGTEIPYLKSVECKYCRESRHYETVQVFSMGEINQLFGPAEDFEIKVTEKTGSGRTKELEINNIKVSGEEFRNKLVLPSRWWSFKLDDNSLIINSRGYGHGLGMCQYGARGMADSGKDYRQILKSYYGNIEFYKLSY